MIRFSSISRRGLVGRLMRAPLQLIPRSAVIPVLQGPLRGARWVSGSFVHGCWLGSYENDKQTAFAREIPKGGTVLDIGANVGYYTLLSSRAVGADGRVIAFEPLPRNLGFLRRHIELNRAENVEVIEAAVSDAPGEGEFHVSSSHAQGGLDGVTTSDEEVGTVRVKIVQLDGLYRDGMIPKPDVLKIDIEGAEARMLEGARTLLTEANPVIFLATHGREVRSRCLALLEELGYTASPLGNADPEHADEFIARPAPEALSSQD